MIVTNHHPIGSTVFQTVSCDQLASFSFSVFQMRLAQAATWDTLDEDSIETYAVNVRYWVDLVDSILLGIGYKLWNDEDQTDV